VQLHNVGMANPSKDRDFAFDLGPEAAFQDLLLVKHLDGDALTSSDGARVINFSKRAMAEEAAKVVPTKEQTGLLLLRGSNRPVRLNRRHLIGAERSGTERSDRGDISAVCSMKTRETLGDGRREKGDGRRETIDSFLVF
jgi:hypothetical protein